MQAVGYNGTEFVNFEKPVTDPLGFDLLVEVRAISINPIDAKIKQTITAKPKTPVILGFDACGVVLAVGDKTTLFKVGDEVFYAGDMTRDGSNAEQQLVDERIVGLKPTSLDFSSSRLTAHQHHCVGIVISPLKNHSKDKDKTLLLIGAAGGVGSMAIQFAKQVIGINVIATASRAESKDWCKQMGADIVLDHQHLAQQFKDNNLDTPKYILCMGVPDDYFDQMIQVIAPQGSICLLANTQQAYDLNLLKAKSITLVWEMMFTRSMFQTNDLVKQHELLNKLALMVENGDIRHTLTQHLNPINVDTITRAHQVIERGKMQGKLVISNRITQ